MTPEQIQKGNIAVAEWCRWKFHPTPIGGVSTANWEMPKGGYTTRISNYHSSLDAMHEAEKHLKPLKHNCDHTAEVCDYERNLCSIVGADASHKWSGDSFKIAHATAPQRFEALLRTIGKWDSL